MGAQVNSTASALADLTKKAADSLKLVQWMSTNATTASSAAWATFVANSRSSVGTVRPAGPISSSGGTTLAASSSTPLCTKGTTYIGGIQSTAVAVKSLDKKDLVPSVDSTAAGGTSNAGRICAATVTRENTSGTTSTPTISGRIIDGTSHSTEDASRINSGASRTPVDKTIATIAIAAAHTIKASSKATPSAPTTQKKAPPKILKQIYGHTLLMYVSFKLRPKFKGSLQRRIAENFPTATAIQFSRSRDADDCYKIHLRFSSKRAATRALNLTRPFRFIYKDQEKFRSAWLLAIKYQFIQSPSAAPPLPLQKIPVEEVKLSERAESPGDESYSDSPLNSASEDELEILRVIEAPHSPTSSVMITDNSESEDEEEYESSDDESD